MAALIFALGTPKENPISAYLLKKLNLCIYACKIFGLRIVAIFADGQERAILELFFETLFRDHATRLLVNLHFFAIFSSILYFFFL